MLEPISLSNGLDWIGDRMYYVDSPTKRIDVSTTTARSTNRRPFATIEEGVGVPDGLVVDDEGGVWLALYGGAQVRRYSPDGELTEKLASPPTTSPPCWFAGYAAVHHHRALAAAARRQPVRRRARRLRACRRAFG